MAKVEHLDDYRIPPRPGVPWTIWVWVAGAIASYGLVILLLTFLACIYW